jgi:membrane protein DedA with SNARE-associated domain
MNARIFKKFVMYFAAGTGLVVGVTGMFYGIMHLSYQLTGTPLWGLLALTLGYPVFSVWEFAKDKVKHEQFEEQRRIDRMQRNADPSAEHTGSHQ